MAFKDSHETYVDEKGNTQRRNISINFLLMGCCMSVVSIVCIIVCSVHINSIQIGRCYPYKCSFSEDECVTNSIKWPCYIVLAQYSLSFHYKLYSTKQETLVRNVVHSVANQTCNEFLANDYVKCYFIESDIDNSLSTISNLYFRWITLLITSMFMFFCGLVILALAISLNPCILSFVREKFRMLRIRNLFQFRYKRVEECSSEVI